MSINKRVLQIIDQVAQNKSSFSKSTGISPVILSHIASGRNKVSLKTVVQILETYPTLNAEYLLLGKGQVFKQDQRDQMEKLLVDLEQLKSVLEGQHKQAVHAVGSLIHHIQDGT